jgi:hypothetical protein
MVRLGIPSPYLLTAPHDGFDLHTGHIVRETCAGLFPQWGCVVAEEYRHWHTPINVNRPTEGISVPASEEALTDRAQDIYFQYLRVVESLSQAPLWYIEIHGNARRESQFKVEVASYGVSKEMAQRIKQSWTSLLPIYGLSEFEILIEPLDSLYFEAESSKTLGSLSRFQPALHVELPRKLRFEKQEEVIQFLRKALAELRLF